MGPQGPERAHPQQSAAATTTSPAMGWREGGSGLSGSTEDTIRIGDTREGMRWVGEDTTRVWACRERGKDPGGREGARD